MPSTPYSFEIAANEHSETLKGGALGGFSGLALGFGGVYAAATRYPAFRQLTLPLRAFLITSSGTFGGTRTSHSLSLPDTKMLHYDLYLASLRVKDAGMPQAS